MMIVYVIAVDCVMMINCATMIDRSCDNVCLSFVDDYLSGSFVRMTISSEVAVHQISFEHRVVNIG